MPRDPFPVPPEITTATMRIALKATNNALPDEETVDIYSQHFNDAMAVIKTPEGKTLTAHNTFGFFKELRRVILDEARFMPLAQRRRYEKRQDNAIFFDEFFRVARSKIKVNKVKIIDEQMKALWCVLDADDVNWITFSDVVKFLKRGSDGERAVRRAKKAQERRERTLAARAANALLDWAPTRTFRAALAAKGFDLPDAEVLLGLARQINDALDERRKDSKNKNATQEKTGGPTVFTVFKEMDEDRSGFLSFDEYQWALRQKLWLSKPKLSDDMLMAMWCVLDWDDNNRVFFDDLAKFLGGTVITAADGTSAAKPPDVQFLLDGRAKHLEALALRKANIDKRKEELYTPAAAVIGGGGSPRRLGSRPGSSPGHSPSGQLAQRPAETAEEALARMTKEVNEEMAKRNESRRRLLAQQRAERSRAWRDFVEDKWSERRRQMEGAEKRKTEAWQTYVRALLPLQPSVGSMGGSFSESSSCAAVAAAHSSRAPGMSPLRAPNPLLSASQPRYMQDQPITTEHHAAAHQRIEEDNRMLLHGVRHMLASPSQLFEQGTHAVGGAMVAHAGASRGSSRPRTALVRTASELRGSRGAAPRAPLGTGSLRYRSSMLRPTSALSPPPHANKQGLRRPVSAAALPSLGSTRGIPHD